MQNSLSGSCFSSNLCLYPLGGLHVCARRCRQHVWEQKVQLLVQSVVGGAQPAGADLGETAEDVPSLSSAVHASAAQHGTDTDVNPAAEMNTTQRQEEEVGTD